MVSVPERDPAAADRPDDAGQDQQLDRHALQAAGIHVAWPGIRERLYPHLLRELTTIGNRLDWQWARAAGRPPKPPLSGHFPPWPRLLRERAGDEAAIRQSLAGLVTLAVRSWTDDAWQPTPDDLLQRSDAGELAVGWAIDSSAPHWAPLLRERREASTAFAQAALAPVWEAARARHGAAVLPIDSILGNFGLGPWLSAEGLLYVQVWGVLLHPDAPTWLDEDTCRWHDDVLAVLAAQRDLLVGLWDGSDDPFRYVQRGFVLAEAVLFAHKPAARLTATNAAARADAYADLARRLATQPDPHGRTVGLLGSAAAIADKAQRIAEAEGEGAARALERLTQRLDRLQEQARAGWPALADLLAKGWPSDVTVSTGALLPTPLEDLRDACQYRAGLRGQRFRISERPKVGRPLWLDVFGDLSLVATVRTWARWHVNRWYHRRAGEMARYWRAFTTEPQSAYEERLQDWLWQRFQAWRTDSGKGRKIELDEKDVEKLKPILWDRYRVLEIRTRFRISIPSADAIELVPLGRRPGGEKRAAREDDAAWREWVGVELMQTILDPDDEPSPPLPPVPDLSPVPLGDPARRPVWELGRRLRPLLDRIEAGVPLDQCAADVAALAAFLEDTRGAAEVSGQLDDWHPLTRSAVEALNVKTDLLRSLAEHVRAGTLDPSAIQDDLDKWLQLAGSLGDLIQVAVEDGLPISLTQFANRDWSA